MYHFAQNTIFFIFSALFILMTIIENKTYTEDGYSYEVELCAPLFGGPFDGATITFLQKELFSTLEEVDKNRERVVLELLIKIVNICVGGTSHYQLQTVHIEGENLREYVIQHKTKKLAMKTLPQARTDQLK